MQGFVMALDYSDQMTGSSANVMNLQCFMSYAIFTAFSAVLKELSYNKHVCACVRACVTEGHRK